MVSIGAFRYTVLRLVLHLDLLLELEDLVVAEFAVIVEYHVAIQNFQVVLDILGEEFL